MSGSGRMLGHDTGESLSHYSGLLRCGVHCSGLLEHRTLCVGRVKLRRHFEMAGHSVVTEGKRLCTVAVEVYQDRTF